MRFFFFFFTNNVHNYIIEDVHFYKWGKEEEEGGGVDAFICSNITYQYVCTTLSKDSKFTGNMDLILQKTKLTSVQIPINNNNGNSESNYQLHTFTMSIYSITQIHFNTLAT